MDSGTTVSPDDDACYICLEGGCAADRAAGANDAEAFLGPLHSCGCSCRGSAGMCHFSCAVKAAQSQNRLWHECATCKHKWSGQFALRLAQERCRQSAKLHKDHPVRVHAALDLMQALRDHGRLTEARSLGTQMLVAMRQTYGDDHKFTLTTMAGLAVTHNSLGDSATALPLEEERLEACLRTLGEHHRDTKNAKCNIAGTLMGLGKVEEALPMMKETTGARRAELGPDHIETITCTGNLAALYHRMNRPDLELPLSTEVVERSRRVLGRQHPQTLLYTGHLGALLSDMNHHEPAISLLQEAADDLVAMYGGQHPHAYTVLRDLRKAQSRRGESGASFASETRAGVKRGREECTHPMRMRKRPRIETKSCRYERAKP